MSDSINTTNTATGSATSGSDFVNFYEMIGAQTEATTTALRRRINELYSEAQNNRDHRNPSKRRQYEALCELLPYCRIVLLDPDKRARYDRYMELAKSGQTVPEFESMMDEIAGNIGEIAGDTDEKIGLLGTEGDDNYLPEKASTVTPTDPATRKKPSARKAADTPAADATTLSGTAGQKRRVSKSAAASLMGSAISVIGFAVVLILAHFLLRKDFHDSVLYAAIVGLVLWVVTHMRPGSSNRISS